MSDEQAKPNPLSFLKFGRGDGKMSGINKLLTSDKDNETKTRIPNVLGMTYLDCMGAWSSPHDYIVLRIKEDGKGETEKRLPKTVEGMALFFGIRYRINAISSGGQSRLEYVDALKSYLAAQAEIQNQTAQQRAEEGAKKNQ